MKNCQKIKNMKLLVEIRRGNLEGIVDKISSEKLRELLQQILNRFSLNSRKKS